MSGGVKPIVVVCKKCGEKNRLPAIHCRKCGAKIDFGAAEAALRKEVRRTGRRRGRWWRTLLMLALAAVLGLAIWPSELERRTGNARDAKCWEMKRAILLDALDWGRQEEQPLAEKEINAWLAKLPAMQEKRGGMAAELLDTAVAFSENRACWYVLVKRGVLRFSVVYEAEAQDAGLVLTGAKLGHLPLPGALGRLYARTQGNLFRAFADEERILRNLDSLAVHDGEIVVRTRAREK